MPTYPYALTVTNPGAETGDATGWTNELGTLSAISDDGGGTTPRTGSYFFWAGSSVFCQAYQDIAIPVDAQADVDAGLVSLHSTFYQSGFVDADSGAMGWWYLDGSGRRIGHFISYGFYNASPNEWVQRTSTDFVFPGTRTIRIYLLSARTSGSGNDCYYDDISLELVEQSGSLTQTDNGSIYSDEFRFKNEDLSTGDPVWTVVSGGSNWQLTDTYYPSFFSGLRCTPTATEEKAMYLDMDAIEEGVYQTQLTPTITNSFPGLFVRCDADATDGYLIAIEPGTGLRLYSQVAGVYSVISTSAIAIGIGVRHDLKAIITDSSQQIYLDGVLRISTTDTTFNGVAGWAGYRAARSGVGSREVRFDEFRIHPNNYVFVTGLLAGYSVRVNGPITDSGADQAFTADESDGGAIVDMGAAWYPANSIEILDADDNVVGGISGIQIHGGHTFAFGAPLPPETPDLEFAGASDTSASFETTAFVPNSELPADTHASTTWQVSLADDTEFSSPVVNVTSATFLVAYIAEGLIPNTNYVARARHTGSQGGVSAWSNTVEFTTEDAFPQPEPPTLSDPPTNIETDEVTLTLSDFDHSEGVTTQEEYDPDTNDLPYLVAIQWQITTDADTGFTADPMTVDTDLVGVLDLVRIFAGLDANTAYRARARQQDGKYGTISDWSNVVEFTTDAEAVDVPGTPSIYIESCSATGVSLTSSPFEPFGVETHIDSQWRARPTSNSTMGQDTGGSIANLLDFSWGALPAGEWFFSVRHKGSNGKWSEYSADASCEIFAKPPVVDITSPVSGIVTDEALPVVWDVPSSLIEWLYEAEISEDDATTFVDLVSTTDESLAFTISSRDDGVYWIRIRACYPESHGGFGQCGDWQYVKIVIDRTGQLAASLDFTGLTDVSQIPGDPVVLWDGVSQNVEWDLVDSGLGSTGPSIGIRAKNYQQLVTRQSVLGFRALGKPLEGRFTATLGILTSNSTWFGHRFVHATYMRGGIGYRIADGGTATTRSGIQQVVQSGVSPWGFYGQRCVCDCQVAADSCSCCENNECAPCETCFAMPTACHCTRHLGDLANRGRTQPGTYWEYGVSYRSAKIERFGRAQGSESTFFYQSTDADFDGDQVRGMGVATRFQDPEVVDGASCLYNVVWYTVETDVRREGTQWRVKTRIVGPGLNPAEGWTQSALVDLGEVGDDEPEPCGYCGLALWHLGSNLVNDHGVVFKSFAVSALEYGECEPQTPPCVRGHALIRVLSKEQHPAHSKLEYMVIGSVPCPDEEAA